MKVTQDILFAQDAATALTEWLTQQQYDRLFVLTDETTGRLCLPMLHLDEAQPITIAAGDVNKSLESLSGVWQALSDGKATRKSMLINLGGGMVTDLGGFAAATFKRGIRFVNVPTTLLAQVDASVGGKTGINFNGLKNEVGTFQTAALVIISTSFLQTLDGPNLCSGYAEMLKHGLISDVDHWSQLMQFDLDHPDLPTLQQLVRRSIEVKEDIVRQDPHEAGIRKALNFGHTLGHALESLAMETGHPVLHGYAVAWGMIGELYESCVRKGFPQDKMRQTVSFIREHYGEMPLDCKQYDRILELMKHDKKNVGGQILCTLLSDIGQLHINEPLSKEDIFGMFDFLREG